MPESIEFNLISITLLEYHFKAGVTKSDVEIEKVMWNYTFSFSIQNFPVNKKCVRPTISYKLYLKNDAKQEALAKIEVSNMFSVTPQISLEAKLIIMEKFLDITTWNLQGIYAAKTEGSPLADNLPPASDFQKHKEEIKNMIEDEWK